MESFTQNSEKSRRSSADNIQAPTNERLAPRQLRPDADLGALETYREHASKGRTLKKTRILFTFPETRKQWKTWKARVQEVIRVRQLLSSGVRTKLPKHLFYSASAIREGRMIRDWPLADFLNPRLPDLLPFPDDQWATASPLSAPKSHNRYRKRFPRCGADGAKSPEIPQKEGSSGSEIAARNRKSLATFHRNLRSQCSTASVLSRKSVAISGVRDAHRNRKSQKIAAISLR